MILLFSARLHLTPCRRLFTVRSLKGLGNNGAEIKNIKAYLDKCGSQKMGLNIRMTWLLLTFSASKNIKHKKYSSHILLAKRSRQTYI